MQCCRERFMVQNTRERLRAERCTLGCTKLLDKTIMEKRENSRIQFIEGLDSTDKFVYGRGEEG